MFGVGLEKKLQSDSDGQVMVHTWIYDATGCHRAPPPYSSTGPITNQQVSVMFTWKFKLLALPEGMEANAKTYM